MDKKNISSLAIDGASGLVCDEIMEDTGAYVLAPCRGLTDYGAIRGLISNEFVAGSLREEAPTIEIENTTSIEGLGIKVKNSLGLPYLNITTANFRGEAKYQTSVIYDNTGGKKPGSLNYLKQTLNILVAQSPFPFPTGSEKPDFVIIAAQDLANQ